MLKAIPSVFDWGCTMQPCAAGGLLELLIASQHPVRVLACRLGLLACLPACLLAYLPACLLACLPACLLACLPACLLACLPACLQPPIACRRVIHTFGAWYSFGILLWELASQGQRPYSDLTTLHQVMAFLKSGARLTFPELHCTCFQPCVPQRAAPTASDL